MAQEGLKKSRCRSGPCGRPGATALAGPVRRAAKSQFFHAFQAMGEKAFLFAVLAPAGQKKPSARMNPSLLRTPPHRSCRFVVCSLVMDWKNRLYFGDNLDILRREVPDADGER
jgi:hypothetical protein